MSSSMDKEKESKICSKRFSNGKGIDMRSHLSNSKPMPMSMSMSMPMNDRDRPSTSSYSFNLQSPTIQEQRSKRHRDEHRDDEPETSMEDSTLLATEAALCLLMMKREGREGVEEDSMIWKFKCKKCNKGFRSYQALGGHNASHKRMDSYNGEDHRHKVFKCSLCPRVFVSGQALGGHKKVHCSIMNNSYCLNNSHPHRLAKASVDLNRPPYVSFDYDHDEEDEQIP